MMRKNNDVYKGCDNNNCRWNNHKLKNYCEKCNKFIELKYPECERKSVIREYTNLNSHFPKLYRFLLDLISMDFDTYDSYTLKDLKVELKEIVDELDRTTIHDENLVEIDKHNNREYYSTVCFNSIKLARHIQESNFDILERLYQQFKNECKLKRDKENRKKLDTINAKKFIKKFFEKEDADIIINSISDKKLSIDDLLKSKQPN